MKETHIGDFDALSSTPRRFLIRGIVAPHGANYAMVGQFTYLTKTGEWPTWDGEHKATEFASAHAGVQAGHRAKGPLFLLPSPETIEAIEITATQFTLPMPL